MSVSSWTPDDAQNALQDVCARAGADPAFRDLCLKSPVDAIREVTGRELPAGYTVRFVDNEKADLTVVLPDMVAASELSDSDLESVSGGIKCLVGSCGATEICGVTDPCLTTKGTEDAEGKPKGRGRA